MADASRDSNFVTTLLAVSNVDGTTPVTLWADPVTHRLLTSPTGSGSGDVVGPASATDNAIARFDTTTGKLIQNSAVTISDTGAINVAGAFTLPIVDGTNLQVLQTNGAGVVSWQSAGSGTVTSMSIVSANGFAGTVATATTTPAVTLTTTINAPALAGNGTAISAATTTGSGSTVVLDTSPVLTTPNIGVATATSVNKVAITAPATSATLTIANSKTLTVNNSITFAGTDATTMTFPTTTATIARTDSAQTFTGVQTMTSPSITTSITTGSTTFALVNTTATTVNFAGAATTLAIGAATGTATIANATVTLSNATTLNINGASPTIASTSTATGSVFNTNILTGNLFGAATTLTVGGTPTGAVTHNYSTNATAAATTKTVNLGTGGAASSTTNVNIGASAGGTTTVNSPNISLGSTTGVTTTGTIELGAASDTTLSRSSAGVLAVEGVVIPSISSTNTLTNKRWTRRLTTTNAPGATPTTNTDNVDIMNFTGLNAAITSMTTNLSGTPSDGDKLEFRFTDNGTARAITWGASFASTTVTLPSTTVISTMLRVLFEWNATTSKWECIATA